MINREYKYNGLNIKIFGIYILKLMKTGPCRKVKETLKNY